MITRSCASVHARADHVHEEHAHEDLAHEDHGMSPCTSRNAYKEIRRADPRDRDPHISTSDDQDVSAVRFRLLIH